MNNMRQVSELKIKHWQQLSKEQLEYVLKCEGNDKGRVDAFLYLMGYEIEKDDIIPEMENGELSMDEWGEWLDLMEDLLSGKKVALRCRNRHDGGSTTMSKDGSQGRQPGVAAEVVYAEAEDLAYASMEQMKWMENDHSLVALPFERMKIGRHEYKMPDAFLMNNTYQQYSNAQGYMMQYWNVMKRLMPPENENDNDDENKNGKSKTGRGKKKWVAPTEEEMVSLARQMMDARHGFMASILAPYRWKVKSHYPFLFRVPLWDAESEKEIKKDMESAPSWLFDALYKQWQDNIKHLRKKFPEMFTEAKEDPKHDAFVAELGTINLVIEKGGYGSASAVYDENCVFVFKLLNDQIKMAKEMEKMEKKSKAGK